jgi:type IV pilus assembly protein PilB
MKVDSQKLKKFILDAGLLEEKKLDQAMEKSQKENREFRDILIEDGLIKQPELVKLEAYLLGIPFINLEKEVISPEVLRIIPEPIARAHNMVAFRQRGNSLEVAMLNPEDLRIVEFVKKTNPSLEILLRLTTPEGIKNVLSQYQKNLQLEFAEMIKEETKDIKHIKEGESFKEKEELKKAAEEIPTIRIVDVLLKHAILQKASDVHIEPLEKEVVVRYRIDGILRDIMSLPFTAAPGIVARIKVLSNLKLDEHRLPQDGRFKIETRDFKYSIRVSIMPVFNGEKVVMRLLAEDVRTINLETLGFYGKTLKQASENLLRPSGMI